MNTSNLVRIHFNDGQKSGSHGAAVPNFVSDDPAIDLAVIRRQLRNRRQLEALQAGISNSRAYNIDDILDGDAILYTTPNEMFEWSYCQCTITRLTQPKFTSSPDDALLGDSPPRPVKQAALQQHSPVDEEKTTEKIILFNVLVALEWQPDDEYLTELKWAFRRASDFLYDATDGRMAFGQVIFADNTWMNCCDIQIMASNRFHPRSWVCGLHDERKYQPIRLGRGFWYAPNRVVIGWGEPEGYRPLVHEWGHYALGLRDKYTETRWIVPFHSTFGANKSASINLRQEIYVSNLEKTGAPVTVPWPTEVSGSIMATTLGTSEISVHVNGDLKANKNEEWNIIESTFKDGQSGELLIKRPRHVLEGPGRLPLPLPQFGFLPALVKSGLSKSNSAKSVVPQRSADTDTPEQRDMLTAPTGQSDETQANASETGMENNTTLKLPPWTELAGLFRKPEEETAPDDDRLPLSDTKPEHCWIYVLRNLFLDQPDQPPRLIAQGTLEARSKEAGFDLLGAKVGDIVVVRYANPRDQPKQFRSEIKGNGSFGEWKLCNAPSEPPNPMVTPFIEVLPGTVSEDNRISAIKVRVKNFSGSPAKVWLFPLGANSAIDLTDGRSIPSPSGTERAEWMSAEMSVKTLDGHVIALWGDVSSDWQVMIVGFSQGGNPPSAGVKAPVPISAGSSDGNVQIFFRDADEESYPREGGRAEEDSKTKVLTTIDNGMRGIAPAGAQACTYPICLADNQSLPSDCDPTLILYYEMPNESELLLGDLFICRLENGRWTPKRTYHPAGASFLVTPLDKDSAPYLFDKTDTAEYFRVFWIRREPSAPPS